MRLRLVGMLLLLGASCGVRADAEHDRIVADRAAAKARLADQERECATRFVVADCVEDARTAHRETLKRLRQQEIQLDEAKRKAAADARRKAIAEKAQAQQARASDAPPEPPKVRMRRSPQPAESFANRPADGAPRRLLGGDPPGADRSALEQRNEEKFERRQREAESHREAAARRNAERAARGKLAAPLPAPSGASAPR